MENEIAALEIRSKNLVLLIGNVIDNKLNVTYKTIRPLSVSLKNGEILDAPSLVNDIKGILEIFDNKHSLKFNINEVSLVLPPYGLEVYNSEKVTNVISNQSRIEKIDISNALNMLKKERILNQNNAIVEIIPNEFIIDGDYSFTNPPLGQTSSQLNVKADIYTLPKKNIFDLMDCVVNAGIKVRRNVISSIGVAEIFKLYNSDFSTYVLVDCGSRNATLTFIGENKPYNSTYFEYGLDYLIDDVVCGFNCFRSDAESLIDYYGYDERNTKFNPPIFENEVESLKQKFYREDLNNIISTYFDKWFDIFSSSLDSLIEEYRNIIPKINLVFIGENTKINGFKKYLEEKLINFNCFFPSLPCIGVEDSQYLNCAGTIVFSSKYKGSLEDDFKGKFKEVEREEKSYNETVDDL